MDNRGIYIKQIHSYLAEWTQHIYQQNASGKFDINKDSENLAINILNLTYGYDLKNANKVLSENFPAIDLVDTKSGIVFQVTSDSSSDKVIETIEKYMNRKIYDNYPKLYIYLLTNKSSYYKPTKDKINQLINSKINFDIEENILDNITIGKHIDSLIDINKIEEILDILEGEFGRKKSNNQLFKPFKSDQVRFKFNFNNRLTSFTGREEELTQLENFFTSDHIFSWWILKGKAGSGKSRLALELGYKLEPLRINWGFLPTSAIRSFEWQQHFHKPTLIIIDYVQSSYLDTLTLIRNLSIRNDLKYPLRILLIERETTGTWWDSLINDYIASNKIHRSDPLELSALNDNSLFAIIENILNVEKKNINLNKL